MFIVFHPWRIIFFAGMLAIAGAALINGSVYNSPYPGRPLYFPLAFGIAIEALSAWIACTAVRYIWHGLVMFFRGPTR